MARGRCGRDGAKQYSGKCCSNRLEFSETCVEYQGIYFGGLVGTLP